jgi:tetratricopeptide (TPR) repeat protein
MKLKKIFKTLYVFIFLIALSVSVSCRPVYAADSDRYVDALVKKAENYSRLKKDSLALMHINQAIKIQPKNPSLYYKRAFITGKAGYYTFSIKDFSKLVNNPGFPHAVRFRGDCFMALNRMNMAAKDYKAFLKKGYKDGKVWSYLAEALYLAGERQQALAAINKGLSFKSHWRPRLLDLKKKIVSGESVEPHKPLSN